MTQSAYNQRINNAIASGFEIYVDTHNGSSAGTILTNTDVKSQYNGECIDLFEDGTYELYSQFKGQQPTYTIS